MISQIKTIRNCEYHIHDDKGRIIATLEGENSGEEMALLQSIQSLQGVISAEMAFAYSEEELEAEREKLEKSVDNIPVWLNDPDAGIADIKYGGDPRNL